ncbi:hypothetical protein K7432_003411 [Basidiobolus ranarum]|uniref:Uncharacterized protein n=1 Tax=Basidiobolus ranarum TaxID=34480 RepID=A0ABR2WZX3_9FUNG
MSEEISPNSEKQLFGFLDWLNTISPQVVLDQEGRRRLTVHFGVKEYDPETDRVIFDVKGAVKQRFYRNGYFQTPRISEILSQEMSLTSSPTFMNIEPCEGGVCGKEGVWKFTYNVEKGEYDDERWIIPVSFECQLQFLTNSVVKEDLSFELTKWFKRLVPWFSTETRSGDAHYQLLAV